MGLVRCTECTETRRPIAATRYAAAHNDRETGNLVGGSTFRDMKTNARKCNTTVMLSKPQNRRNITERAPTRS
jgi:hypothetical protein